MIISTFNKTKYAAIALGLSIISIQANSQEATASPAEKAAAPKLWSGSIDLGYTDLSGNTEETSTNGKVALKRKRNAWTYLMDASARSSKQDGDRSAEKYELFNRLRYNFQPRNYVFGRAAYEEDHFSGLKYQATVSTGLGRNLIDRENMAWDIETGIGYRVSEADNGTATEDESEAIFRLASDYTWQITKTAAFEQHISTEAGSDNTVSTSETSLKLQVIGEVSLKLSYKVKYSETVPNGTKHADTETRAALSYAF